MTGDKKLICFLIAFIILLCVILLFKIETEPKYDPKIYDEIYNEYEYIFGKEDTLQENEESKEKNKQQNSNTKIEEKQQKIVIGTTDKDLVKTNVIGKIIIPKINIQYPIIKETTTEYLKVAPTKYSGPDVNEIR